MYVCLSVCLHSSRTRTIQKVNEQTPLTKAERKEVEVERETSRQQAHFFIFISDFAFSIELSLCLMQHC